MNQKAKLTAFWGYREVPISNNLAENAIRPFVVGRKNWLFRDSVKGAEPSAIVYSLVETVKVNGSDAYDYLFYILSLLSYYGKSISHADLDKLMPWNSTIQKRYDRQQPQPGLESIDPETE